jgi:hypothetical protein
MALLSFGFRQILANFPEFLRPLYQRAFAALLLFYGHRLVNEVFGRSIRQLRRLFGLLFAWPRAVRRARNGLFD